MGQIKGDLEKFMIYKNSDTGELIAIDKVNTPLMDSYYRDFNKFKETPENITIDGYMLIQGQESDTLEIDISKEINVKVKNLTSTLVRMGKV